MATKRIIEKKDISTEDKIKSAAKKLFTQKGFEATKTRDIAEEAGINLALLNYYFRSKQKLFEIVMRENVGLFMGNMLETINNSKELSFNEKVDILTDKYIDMLIANPDLPYFILSISRTETIKRDNNTDPLFNGIKQMRKAFMQTILEDIQSGKIKPVHPIHIMSNLLSMIVFPFAASNIIKSRSKLSDKEFEELMMERKLLIPIWIKAMFNN